MLSKKMTFSLMSLIIIFALAFVVTPAMAEFGVSMSIHPEDDISTADGAQADPLQPVRVRVKFDKIVVKGSGMGFDKSDIKVFAQDEFGRPVASPALSAVSDYTPADGLNYMFTVPVPAATTAKVILYMEKHAVELADPRAEIGDDGKRKAAGKSAAAALEINYLLDFDHGAPRVYGIRRASPHERPAVLQETADSFQVVITLSEMPKEFKKDHIDVSNATAGDPVALLPIAATNLATFGRGLAGAPTALSLYTAGAVSGLHAFLNADDNTALIAVTGYTDLSEDLQKAIMAYITARTAYEAQRGTSSYFLEIADDNIPATEADDGDDGNGVMDKDKLPRKLPSSKLTIGSGTGEINLTTIVTADSMIDVSKAPAVPDQTATAAIRTDFGLLNDAYMEYTKAKAAMTAYEAAVRQASKDHDAAIQEYLSENIGTATVTAALQTAQPATGTDKKLHRYYVVITPKFENKNDVVVKVKSFEDLANPPNKYTPPITDRGYTEGYDKLTVKIGAESPIAKTGGLEVVIPKEKRIPASGYIVFTKNAAGSGILKPAGSDKDEPKANERNPAQLLYNVVDLGIPNLESFLANGGTIDLIGSGLYISEIMWGSDASLDPNNNSQWIEVANSGSASILTGDKTHKLIFYGPNETLPAVSTVADRVGTVGASGYWSTTGMGQSGRSGTGEQAADIRATIPTQALISMQRLMGADGTPADGTMASSWAASTPPGLNFDLTKVGTRVGSPGAAPVAYPVAPTPEPEPAPAPVVPVAGAMDIMITEIMVDTGNGRLPQWIELTNVSGAEKSLAGWSLMITNAAADANVIGATVNINLSGTLGVGGGMDAGGTMGKSLLLVGGSARSSSNLAGSDRVVDISSQVNQRGRYAFISTMGFMAALIPPQKTGVLAYGDTAGNLGADAAWDIPMDDSGRSSLIRREMLADGMATMGTDANGWVLASDTPLVSGPATWYGSDEDAGTPGYDAGGPLPVELSHFRPARDKATGAVVITWATESELNNAGFFIKRSNQRDGEFQVINATMVPGAGTTSEKQTYTYTDTTAQPNIVYYYQIEDVSLDGQRQTLTRGIRLKGHIGAAGKLTSTWGELKSSNE